MSLPNMLKENERTDAEWRRKARDSINRTAQRVMGQGSTAERPPGAVTGTMFYDTDLSKPVWRDVGGVWRDAAGTAV